MDTVIEIPSPKKLTIVDWDRRFLEAATVFGSWSKDPSTKVGAVIVRTNKSICSVGFNGFPQGMDDSPELYANREEKYSRVVHAEINALTFANEKVNGYTLYTTPFITCDRCFVQMAQAGITRFVSYEPTKEQNERWGAAFEKVRRYAVEMNLVIYEYGTENFSSV